MSDRELPPKSIAPNLYQLGTEKFPVYLSLGREGMLIEGGTGASAGMIVKQLQDLGVEPSRVRYMALTHTHADHIGAVPRLRQLWPHLRIIAGPKAAEALGRPDVLDSFLPADLMISNIFLNNGLISEMPAPLDHYRFDVDWVVRDGETIDLGDGVTWQALHTPGHCPDHVAYYDQNQAVIALGDMTGYYDPSLDVLWPNYFGSLHDYCASLRRMVGLPARLGLLSHNGALDLGGGAFLERSLAATVAYHWEMLHLLSRGVDHREICGQKAEWVYSFAPIASLKAINFLCKSLLNQSRAAMAPPLEDESVLSSQERQLATARR